LPDSILRLVYEALSSAAAGKKLRLVEEDEEVSPEKAAEFLQVSRPYFVRLLGTGEIPFHYVGTHRRDGLEMMMKAGNAHAEFVRNLIHSD
jgi:excisionase family DNA binding protein